LEDPDLHWRIILRWMFRKWVGGTWTGLIWLRIRTGGGHLRSGVMNLRVPYKAENFLTCSEMVSFPRRTPFHGVSK